MIGLPPMFANVSKITYPRDLKNRNSRMINEYLSKKFGENAEISRRFSNAVLFEK